MCREMSRWKLPVVTKADAGERLEPKPNEGFVKTDTEKNVNDLNKRFLWQIQHLEDWDPTKRRKGIWYFSAGQSISTGFDQCATQPPRKRCKPPKKADAFENLLPDRPGRRLGHQGTPLCGGNISRSFLDWDGAYQLTDLPYEIRHTVSKAHVDCCLARAGHWKSTSTPNLHQKKISEADMDDQQADHVSDFRARSYQGMSHSVFKQNKCSQNKNKTACKNSLRLFSGSKLLPDTSPLGWSVIAFVLEASIFFTAWQEIVACQSQRFRHCLQTSCQKELTCMWSLSGGWSRMLCRDGQQSLDHIVEHGRENSCNDTS